LSLSQSGQLDEAVDELQAASDLKPDSAEYCFNLGFVLSMRGDFSRAIVSLKAAVAMSGGKDWRFLTVLAGAYEKSGRPTDAAEIAQQALDVAVAQHDDQAAAQLRGALEHFQQETAQPPSQ